MANNRIGGPEKPSHLEYLMEFRVNLCFRFLYNECKELEHDCFDYHEPNQRRRRSIMNSDGTFNYSSKEYCTKYNEETGICPDGDECPFLHRTYGNTEHYFHYENYKTLSCLFHEGPDNTSEFLHCPLAHLTQDFRQWIICDILRRQNPRKCDKAPEKIFQLTPDALAQYKTRRCNLPPRLCQGPTCPLFHNRFERRRILQKYNYTKDTCHQVCRRGEWLDPAHCSYGDGCKFCNTRTEFEYHAKNYDFNEVQNVVEKRTDSVSSEIIGPSRIWKDPDGIIGEMLKDQAADNAKIIRKSLDIKYLRDKLAEVAPRISYLEGKLLAAENARTVALDTVQELAEEIELLKVAAQRGPEEFPAFSIQKMDLALKCILCKKAYRSVTFNTCNCNVICEDCLKFVKKCPFCQCSFNSVI